MKDMKTKKSSGGFTSRGRSKHYARFRGKDIMVQPRIAATAIKTPFDSHGPGVASRAYARLLELIDVSYRPGSPGALSAFALRL